MLAGGHSFIHHRLDQLTLDVVDLEGDRLLAVAGGEAEREGCFRVERIRIIANEGSNRFRNVGFFIRYNRLRAGCAADIAIKERPCAQVAAAILEIPQSDTGIGAGHEFCGSL